MAEFCVHERHGGVCEKTKTYCNLGACPYENMKEFVTAARGRWIHHDDGVVTCSECGNAESSDSYYCRYCGAKMGGGAK